MTKVTGHGPIVPPPTTVVTGDPATRAGGRAGEAGGARTEGTPSPDAPTVAANPVRDEVVRGASPAPLPGAPGTPSPLVPPAGEAGASGIGAARLRPEFLLPPTARNPDPFGLVGPRAEALAVRGLAGLRDASMSRAPEPAMPDALGGPGFSAGIGIRIDGGGNVSARARVGVEGEAGRVGANVELDRRGVRYGVDAEARLPGNATVAAEVRGDERGFVRAEVRGSAELPATPMLGRDLGVRGSANVAVDRSGQVDARAAVRVRDRATGISGDAAVDLRHTSTSTSASASVSGQEVLRVETSRR